LPFCEHPSRPDFQSDQIGRSDDLLGQAGWLAGWLKDYLRKDGFLFVGEA
jgi:hypothetical protein